MPEEDLVDVKLRLYDGSDMGPFRYSAASTVDVLKQRIVSDWPKGKTITPKAATEVKLINSGKILENNKAVGQCRVPFGDSAGGVIIMHVVVQPSLAKTKAENLMGFRSSDIRINKLNDRILPPRSNCVLNFELQCEIILAPDPKKEDRRFAKESRLPMFYTVRKCLELGSAGIKSVFFEDSDLQRSLVEEWGDKMCIEKLWFCEYNRSLLHRDTRGCSCCNGRMI